MELADLVAPYGGSVNRIYHKTATNIVVFRPEVERMIYFTHSQY